MGFDRKLTHRNWYPNRRKGEKEEDVTPLVKADSVVNADGVQLDFLHTRRSLTPRELKGLAKWLYALAHEAQDLAANDLISETRAYDVVRGKVLVRDADN